MEPTPHWFAAAHRAMDGGVRRASRAGCASANWPRLASPTVSRASVPLAWLPSMRQRLLRSSPAHSPRQASATVSRVVCAVCLGSKRVSAASAMCGVLIRGGPSAAALPANPSVCWGPLCVRLPGVVAVWPRGLTFSRCFRRSPMSGHSWSSAAARVVISRAASPSRVPRRGAQAVELTPSPCSASVWPDVVPCHPCLISFGGFPPVVRFAGCGS